MSDDKGKKKKVVVQKYNMDEVDDIWNFVLSESPELDDEDELDDLLYGESDPDLAQQNDLASESGGDQFPDENSSSPENDPDSVLSTGGGPPTGAETLYEETDHGSAHDQAVEDVEEGAPGTDVCSAVLEYVGGMRQEVAHARLFHPQQDSLFLRDEETNDEIVVFFEQLACVRVPGMPAGISARGKESAAKERIETVDGTIHQVLVPLRQNAAGVLLCFATEEHEPLPIIFFPKANIRKRCQDKPLVDIMLEKRFISRTIIQKALQEFEQIKGMAFEKILALQTRVPLADIEKAIDEAGQNQLFGLQAGEILLISGLVNEEQILDAFEYHEQLQNLEIGQFLIDKEFANEMEVYICLGEKHRIPFVDLRQRKIPRESLALLPESMIRHHEILPLVKKGDALLVASHRVDMTDLHETLVNASGCRQVRYVLTPPTQIRKAIHLYFDKRKQ
ncbi:MAG: GspE/PulE/PilB domain-containing protein [Desulfobulbaceae bacterium]